MQHNYTRGLFDSIYIGSRLCKEWIFTPQLLAQNNAYVAQLNCNNQRLLTIAGLNEELTSHSLRHTHTSILAKARVSLEQIMDRLGHTDDQITKNVYLHVTQEMKKEASQKFSELMKSLFNILNVSILLANRRKTLIFQGFRRLITSCRP
ncbi:tyrosine-type recombinase/integrase [Bacillus alkalicola]|nr:tyrosine-type recombinase/integrase [Bacillus alkalicola]